MEQEQRRLAAILAADVVGCSRLMAADEAMQQVVAKVPNLQEIDKAGVAVTSC